MVEYCLESHEIVVCKPLLAEIRKNLKRKLKLPEATVDEISRFLEVRAEIVKPDDVDPQVCRDPDDLMVLGTATAAGASYVITGDEDLLEIDSYAGIPIVRPREFWERVRKST